MSQGFYPGQTESKLRAITAFAQGSDDPSVVPTVGITGTLYVQVGTTNIFQKQDDGRSVNWIPFGGGGGGVPSAPVDSIQFNNAGAFGGSANFLFNSANSLVQLGNTTTDAGGSRKLVVGVGNTVQGTDSVFVGSTINSSGFNFNECFVLGSGLTALAAATRCLIVGNAHVVQTASTSNIVTGNANQVRGSNNVILGGSNNVPAVNSVIAGSSHTTTGTTSRSVLAGNSGGYNIVNDSVLAGTSIIATGVITSSLVAGGSGTYVDVSQSLAIGLTNISTVALTNSIYAGTLNTLASANHAVVSGQGNTFTLVSQSLTAGVNNNYGANIFTSLIAGNGNIFAGGAQSSMVVGSTQTITGGCNNSVVSGNGGTISGTVADSMILGSGPSSNGNVTASIFGGDSRSHTGTGAITGSFVSGSGVLSNGSNVAVVNSIISGGAHLLGSTPLGNAIVSGSDNIASGTNVFASGTLNVVSGAQGFVTGTNNTAGHTNSAVFGQQNASGRTNQMLVGQFYPLADTRAIYGVGIGTGVGSELAGFAIDDDGLMRQTQGGQRVKSRTDAGAAVTVDPRTDYAIACTNAGAITATLPAGVDGMQYLIAASTTSGGVTLAPTGGDTVDNTAIAAGSSRVIFFNSGVWY